MKIFEITNYTNDKGATLIIHTEKKTGEKVFFGIVRIISEQGGRQTGSQDLQFKFPGRVKTIEGAFKCYEQAAEKRYKEFQEHQDKLQEEKKKAFQKHIEEQKKAQKKSAPKTKKGGK